MTARDAGGSGLRVVALGGGTGLPVVLRALKGRVGAITAIVTVTDDGGSSGRLRGEMGILPPGDIRNCLVALAETEPLMERLFQYRFNRGSLRGHAFGNLFIGALSDLLGDFEAAVEAASRVLRVHGRVLPSTLENVQLRALLADGREIRGETAIGRAGVPIRRIDLDPRGCRPVPAALEALAAADLVVLGPGSLYTSVLPNLLVEGIAAAIRAAPAVKVYIANIMTQPGETRGYTASDHLRAIHDHAGAGLVDRVLVNSGAIGAGRLGRYRAGGAEPVAADVAALEALGVRVHARDLVSRDPLVRHDPAALAEALLEIAAARAAVP